MRAEAMEGDPVSAGLKPIPEPIPVTQPYWDAAKKREPHIQKCQDCDGHVFYPIIYCPHCGSSALQWQAVSGRAALLSYVINHIAAPGYEGEISYVIAIVKLKEGPTLDVRNSGGGEAASH